MPIYPCLVMTNWLTVADFDSQNFKHGQILVINLGYDISKLVNESI